ncbi:MAG: flippase-like domain-containing protein [Elusimicrobia bacterium]|nr:flippase-like domain-containing protein [Elusimicrobiota bacterium]
MRHGKIKKKLAIYLPMILSCIILFLLIYPKHETLFSVIFNSDAYYLSLSLAFSVLSYFAMGFSLWETLKIMGHKISLLDSVAIAWVSTTVNYFLSSGGVSGFAVRAHLLAKRHVPYSICITSSVVLTAFIYLILDIIILNGFVMHFLSLKELNGEMIEGIIGISVLLLVSSFFVTIIYHHEFRSVWAKKIYHLLNKIVYFFSKKEIPPEDFELFETQLNEGVYKIHEKKYELPKVASYIAFDWICNILILFFAFKAIGVKISFAKLIIGFSFGMLMTVIPILPGGLGAMEAAMAAAYSNMGIQWEKALAAALIFRIFYYIIPSLISVFVYFGLKISEPKFDYENFIKRASRIKKSKEKINYDI